MSALETVLFCLIPTLVLLLVLFSLRRELADNRGAIALLLCATVLFFHRIIFLREALSQEDANLLQAQFFSVFREAVRAYGEIPFWNPYQGAGLPNLAHPLSALFYPLAPIFLVGSVFEAMNLFVALHYLLAGVFALLVGRRIFATRQAALLFAVLYAFNGWAIMRAAHQPAIEYMFAYTWLPLVALGFERAVAGESALASVAAMGAGLAWMGIASPNVFVYAMVILAAALVLRCASLAVSGRINAVYMGIAAAAGACILAFALGAVEYLPARELSAYSTKGRFGWRLPADWRGQPLSLWTTVKLYFPFTGARPFGVYYSAGVLALVLAGYGLYKAARVRLHRHLAIGALAVLVMGIALVTKSPLYSTLARMSDTFSRASLVPAGQICLVLPVAALAATGLDTLLENKRLLLGRAGMIVVLAVFAELFVGFGLIYPRHGDRRLTFNYAVETADFPQLDAIASQADPGRLLVESPEGEALAPAYATLPRGLSRLNLHASAFAPDALADVIGAVTTNPLPQDLEPLGVGWIASTAPLAGLAETTAVPWPGVADHYENSLYFPMHNLPGWLAWDRTVHLYRVTDTPALVRAEPLTRDAVITGHSPGAIEDLEGEALSCFQPWEPITSTVHTINTLTVLLPEDAPLRFFFAVTDYPGWRLYADGEEVPLAPAASAFMAADIPQGARVVELRFLPTNWGLAFVLALGALVFVAAAVGGQVRFRKSA